MWIYTNSPNTPRYLTPGKLYKFRPRKYARYGGWIDRDSGQIIYVLVGIVCAHLDGDNGWSQLSDYHAKHLTD